MNRMYFSLAKTKQTATLNIYGDITSYPWAESDVSSSNLSRQLESLGDVSEINVYINSYGGEVAEGLAIYNALRRHKAKVKTYCDGFACSIASVIFMAGDERIMNESSLLMVHNAWTLAEGNAEALRKQADDLEKITQASVEAYKAHSTLSEDEIRALMDAETWILPSEAIDYGFATAIEKTETKNASQSAWLQLFGIVKAHRGVNNEETPEDDLDEDDQEPTADEPEKDAKADGETGGGSEDDPETENGKEPENGSEEEPTEDPEEKPADDDTEDDTEDETDAEKPEEEPAQNWRGFFNSILKL